MSDPIPAFVEVCAGLGAVSLMLQHGKHCKPPVSRMGAKHGYSLAILRVMGLRPGQRAEQYLWCEPDPGCRALLTAYTDPALMREAADIIRGWKDEDPRALWTRLRAEGPIRDFGAREVGRHVLMGVWSYRQSEPDSGFIGPGQRRQDTSATATATATERIAEASELARYLQVTASNRLFTLDPSTMTNAGKGGTTFGGADFATSAEKVSEAAREVARFATVSSWCYEQGNLAKGFAGPDDRRKTIETLSEGFDRPLGLPATIVPDAREVYPPPMPDGCVAYMDGPYENTTGYGHLFPRSEQVEVIRRWADAGAACYVSEAEPIPELVADGWQAVEITSCRIGQKRTFSKQKREWVTCNREPAWTPAVQQGLFG